MTQYHYLACRACKLTWDETPAGMEAAREHRDRVHPPRRTRYGEWRYPVRVGAVTVSGHVGEGRCGGSCLTATGPDCECSCGGLHHGRYA